MLKTSLPKLPETPGVYIYSRGKDIIYIGKAINLKNRVNSYFNLHLEEKTRKMIESATNLRFIKVESELEALLLEAKLIKKFKPHYNIISKDDKHPLYIEITNEEFPRVITARKNGAYGPFPNSQNVKYVLRMLRRIFPYSDHKITRRPCLYSHIGLCNPCPNEITGIKIYDLRFRKKKEYLRNIRNLKRILNGNVDSVRKTLTKEMDEFSKKEKYEEAKEVRDKIEKLEYITRRRMPTDNYLENPNLYEEQREKEVESLIQILKSYFLNLKSLKRIECFDIAHLQGSSATASMVVAIDGEMEKSEYRHFKIRQIKKQSDFDSMEEIARRRNKHFKTWGKPNLIIVDGSVGQINKFKKNIQGVPIVGIAKNPDRLVIDSENKIKLEGLALNLVARMRNEAHRFARRLHHKLLSDTLLLNKKE